MPPAGTGPGALVRVWRDRACVAAAAMTGHQIVVDPGCVVDLVHPVSIPKYGLFPACRQFRMWFTTVLLKGDPIAHVRNQLGSGDVSTVSGAMTPETVDISEQRTPPDRIGGARGTGPGDKPQQTRQSPLS